MEKSIKRWDGRRKRSERRLKKTGNIDALLVQKRGALRQQGAHLELRELVKRGINDKTPHSTVWG